MVMLRHLSLLLVILSFGGCASTPTTLYDQLGGQEKIALIVDNFLKEIEFDAVIFQHFKDSDVSRFREKLIEQLCAETGGNCQYTGDSMEKVHTGMKISESDFNRTVDLLINAMTKADVSYPLQNRVLAKLAPMRADIYQR
jgi:hemoglobin